MIDFIKFEVKNLHPKILRESNLLDFQSRLSVDSGELNLGSYINAYYKGLEFKIFHITPKTNYERITVEGSLHKFWNCGAHNFNDFTIADLNTVLKELKEEFAIYPKNCVLRQLEIGLNIAPPIYTKRILRACILHKTKRFEWISTRDEGNYIQAKYQRHIFKLYDKKTHYQNKGFRLPNEIMRVEVKWLKMHELNRKGIQTLAGLIKYGIYNFIERLIQEWEKVIFADYEELANFNYQNEYTNPNFWENLNYENFKYHRKKLREVTLKNVDNYHRNISDLIKEKGEVLNSGFTDINRLNIRLLSEISKATKSENQRKFCRLTGYNISMQRESSILLSHNGLRYYHRTDRKLFNEIKRKYLTKKWMRSSFDIQIREIAHNIRNKHYNQKRKSLFIKG